MANLKERGLLLRLIPVMALVAIFGLAPRPHTVNKSMERSNRAIADSAFTDASKYLADAANQTPWRADLWEMAGHYALLGGDHGAAIAYLHRATDISQAGYPYFQDGLTVQGLTDLGDAYEQSGDLPQAIRYWQSAVGSEGLSVELIDRIVQAHLDLGDYPAAIHELARLIKVNPEDAQLHYRLGLLMATQDPEAAINFLTRAAEMDPNLAAPVSSIRRGILSGRVAEDPGYSLITTGRALAAIEKWDLAAEAFRQATLIRPDYAEGWAYLGESLQHLPSQKKTSENANPERKDGLAELQKALELDPESLAAHTFLALYWTRKARYDLALDGIQSALEMEPQNPVLQVQLGDILAASGDFQSAYEAYARAVDLAPHDPAYQRYLVDFALAYDFQVEGIALPIARRLVVSEPRDPANLALMGRVMIKTGDLLNAKRFLIRSLEYNPDYAPAHLHLGLVYILTGDEASALQEFQLASNLAPNSSIADQATRLMETYFP